MNKKGQFNQFNIEQGKAMLGNFILLIIFVVIATVGGLLAGMLYYDMALMKTTLQTVDFNLPIQDNATATALNMTTFQDILRTVAYPILDLRSTLPYLTYFMIFAFIIALGISAYVSSKNAVFFVLHILFTLLISYFCILISNEYSKILSDPFINAMMLNFVIYNKIMLYLPQVVFFTSLLFGVIAFIAIVKPQSNSQLNQSTLNYGGDW